MRTALALLTILGACSSQPTDLSTPASKTIWARVILMSPDFRYPTGAPINPIYVTCAYELGTGRLIRCVP